MHGKRARHRGGANRKRNSPPAPAPAPVRWIPACYQHVHQPFLEEEGQDVPADSKYGLGAFLTLRLVVQFAPENGASLDDLKYPFSGTEDFLLQLRRNPEADHLLAIVREARQAKAGDPEGRILKPMMVYARWLNRRGRRKKAVDVLATALHSRAQDDSRAVWFSICLCDVLLRSGRFHQAMDTAEAAALIAARLERRDLVAQSQIRLARALLAAKGPGRMEHALVGLLPLSSRYPRVLTPAYRLMGDYHLVDCHN